MLNKVMLIGRLGKDPELRYGASGTPVVNMRMATDESYMDREGNKVDRTEWHTIIAFQRQAESCANYLSKGSLIFVEGSLQTRQWQDQQGQTRYITEIRASRIQFLERKGAQGGYGQQAPAYEGDDMGYQQSGAPQSSRPAQQRNVGNAGSAGKQSANAANTGGSYPSNNDNDDLGPAFPSEASNMDDVPF